MDGHVDWSLYCTAVNISLPTGLASPINTSLACCHLVNTVDLLTIVDSPEIMYIVEFCQNSDGHLTAVTTTETSKCLH